MCLLSFYFIFILGGFPINLLNAPGFYDPAFFDPTFFPAETFPTQPQFMPPFRPPVYDEFWDGRTLMPPQGNFAPFGGNMGGGMVGATGIPAFRGNSNFRGGFGGR